ncbi:MAG: hypothetical protein GX783_12205 [Clostridiales bacterium]|nr:hypothetical protein [Clostridiales bacterium]
MIKPLMEQSISRWWKASSILNKTSEKVSFVDKIKNEKIVEVFRKDLFETLEQIPEDKQFQPDVLLSSYIFYIDFMFMLGYN